MPNKITPAIERFWRYVRKTGPGGCWLWTGGRHQAGYGSFSISTGRKMGAHRFAYETLVGQVPDGLELDHLCRTPACVRPEHLEPVTRAENTRRGNAWKTIAAIQRAKTHCPQGHPYDKENTYLNRGERTCRTCGRAASKAYQRIRRAKIAANRRNDHGT